MSSGLAQVVTWDFITKPSNLMITGVALLVQDNSHLNHNKYGWMTYSLSQHYGLETVKSIRWSIKIPQVYECSKRSESFWWLYFPYVDHRLVVVVYWCVYLPLQTTLINISMMLSLQCSESVQWLSWVSDSTELLTLKIFKIHASPGLIQHSEMRSANNIRQQKAATVQRRMVWPTSNAFASFISIVSMWKEKALLTISSDLRAPASQTVEDSCVSSQTGLYVFGCLAKWNIYFPIATVIFRLRQ